jgi:hypothetical protein
MARSTSASTKVSAILTEHPTTSRSQQTLTGFAPANGYTTSRWSRLLSFFEELEADGHICFFIELDAFDRLDPWFAKGEFVLNPGEELTAAVEALRTLLAMR